MVIFNDFEDLSTEDLLEMRNAIQNQLRDNEKNPKKMALRKLYLALKECEEIFGKDMTLFMGKCDNDGFFQLNVNQCAKALKDTYIF